MNQTALIFLVQIGMHYARHMLEEDMQIIFDLGPRRRGGSKFRNKDIWMLVET